MNTPILPLAALVGLLTVETVLAAPPSPPPPPMPICTNMSAGGITVSECELSGVPDYGWYNLSNQSGQAIYGFAVSTQNTNTASWAQYAGWTGAYLTEAQWNSRFGLGSFDGTFGTSDTGAYVFGNNGGTPHLILPGETVKNSFGFSGKPYSNFVAINSSGSVIAQSFTASVPEPETYAMLIVGLGVLGFMRGRRKNAS